MSNYFDHPDYIDLRRNVLLNAHDDAPRLVLADWIEEHGDENRAEYIRASIEVDGSEIETLVLPFLFSDVDYEAMGHRTPLELSDYVILHRPLYYREVVAANPSSNFTLGFFQSERDMQNKERCYFFDRLEYMRLYEPREGDFKRFGFEKLEFVQDERPEWIKLQKDRFVLAKYRTIVDQGSFGTMIEDECRQFSLKHLLPPASHRIDPQAYFVYKRGFPEQFSCLMEFFVQHHKAMFESMPLTSVTIRDANPSRAGGRATWNSTDTAPYYLSGTLIPMFLFRHMNQGYGSDLHGRTYPSLESANKALQDAIETYRMSLLKQSQGTAKFHGDHFIWWLRREEETGLRQSEFINMRNDILERRDKLAEVFRIVGKRFTQLDPRTFETGQYGSFRCYLPNNTIIEFRLAYSPLTAVLVRDYLSVVLPTSALETLQDLPGIITDLNGKRI